MLNKGFTLLEVLAAIFILTMGIGGAFVLVSQTAVSSQLASAKLTASYLAQEGIENIRNIRDSNFLKIHKGETAGWLDGLADSEVSIDLGTSFKRKITVTNFTDWAEVSVEVSWQERGRSHKVAAQEALYKWLR